MCKYEESLEKRANELMDKCEKLAVQSLKLSGISVMDVITDAEIGALIGGGVDLYKSSKELVLMQAKTMDKLVENFEELKEMNEILRKQNSEMQQLLRDNNLKIEKIDK